MRLALLLLLAAGLAASPLVADAHAAVPVVEMAEERAVLPVTLAPDETPAPARPAVADDALDARPDEPPPTPPPER